MFFDTRYLLQCSSQLPKNTHATLMTRSTALNRSIGGNPAVTIFNTSRVDLAALAADQLCGDSTQLIYYMAPGQVLSRTFTAKDTHSAKGDLLVGYAESEETDMANIVRALATTRLLGFQAPSFTFGMDLILPAVTNAQLRNLLHPAVVLSLDLPERVEIVEEWKNEQIEEYISAVNISHHLQSKMFLPEVSWIGDFGDLLIGRLPKESGFCTQEQN